MGLLICKSILAKLGGKIIINNGSNTLTSFKIQIPSCIPKNCKDDNYNILFVSLNDFEKKKYYAKSFKYEKPINHVENLMEEPVKIANASPMLTGNLEAEISISSSSYSAHIGTA